MNEKALEKASEKALEKMAEKATRKAEVEAEVAEEESAEEATEKEYIFEVSFEDDIETIEMFRVTKNGEKEVNLNPHQYIATGEFQIDPESEGTPELAYFLHHDKPFGSEVKIYQDLDGDELFELVGKQWVGSSEPPTDNVMPALAHVLRFLPTDGDDDIAVEDGETSEGGEGDDQFVITTGGDLTIADFNSDEDTLVFNTGIGLTGKQQLIDAISNLYEEDGNLIVEFSQAATITLIGVTTSDIGWDDVDVVS